MLLKFSTTALWGVCWELMSSIQDKEVLFTRDTILNEEKLAILGEKNVREIMVRGSSLASGLQSATR